MSSPDAATELARAYCAFAACFAGHESVGACGDQGLLAACLRRDLAVGQEEDIDAMYTMLPFVYTAFSSAALSSAAVLRCFVGAMDAEQLLRVTTQLQLGAAAMFLPSHSREIVARAAEVAAGVLRETLTWETFEQVRWSEGMKIGIPEDFFGSGLDRICQNPFRTNPFKKRST